MYNMYIIIMYKKTVKKKLYTFVELHTLFFLLFSLLFKITLFPFSTLNSQGVPYIARKPMVYKPPASV